MARICVFDVNETLLDLSGLDPPFERAFGRPGVRREWFGQFLQSAFVSTITDAYTDFGTIGRAALEMVARRNGVELAADERDSILATMRTLPPHPEVAAALERLREAGIRLAALTNSTEAVATAQLTSAGLAPLFERILSADAARRLKPAREPYEMAARELGTDVGGIRLVAAHAWDITGALRAGAAAAFVARPGMVLDPLAPVPDIVGADLAQVADRILEVDLAA
ncbi:MAG TPA: haloacid dehalogenase type II [Candidatus Limnocylindrales bacterium]|nr:haloacid dehalogenase type II [Candidatus Limnocylindrales bacterium]